MIHIFVGPPGSGKGTQAKRICEALGYRHISTGDLLRGAISKGTELGIKAKSYMDQGALVPDELVFGLLREAMNEGGSAGFLLDGFPRNVAQAGTLSDLLSRESWSLGKVVHFSIEADALLRRLVGRRSCPQCGAVYHVETQRPQTDGVCDRCGTQLVHRSDDTEEVIRKRLTTYWRDTAPILDFYRSSGHLLNLDAAKPAEEVSHVLLGMLQS